MSVSANEENKIFNEAYSGNLVYVKSKVDEDKTLVNSQDSVGFLTVCDHEFVDDVLLHIYI